MEKSLTDSEVVFWLSNIKNMWYEKIHKLVTYFGNPQNIYRADRKALENCGILFDKDIDAVLQSRKTFDIAKERQKLKEKGILFVTVYDETYPEKLKQISDFPYILYLRGNPTLLECLNCKTVAIIGARVCTQYGIYAAEKFAIAAAKHEICVISGMARGIDSAVHKGSLQAGGITIAVLGCGVDICYPPENKQLYEQLVKKGLIISEYPCGMQPMAWQFPKRNRIISALSDVVVITEAKEKSGTLITAKWALEYGREVCAVPGRINDPLSRGCNQLIRDGAMPVLNEEDLLLLFGINAKKLKKEKKFLEKENEVVYSVLGLYPISTDEIEAQTGLTNEAILRILLKLQLAGLVLETGKNLYVRKK